MFVLAAALALAAPSPPNALAGESSAYLLAHARNPVRWQPWGPNAFAEAKRRGVPVFLSVGYSSCHWCHVMERESFADRGIARFLNRHFVCIKVDREERPDVDEVYMAALVAGTGRGGWPMSLFLTPDGAPVVGGTYWPPRDRPDGKGGTVLGFETVLRRVEEAYRTRPTDIAAQAKQLAGRTRAELGRAKLDPAPLTRALVDECAGSFDLDPEFGGFGLKFAKYAGPKFPRVPSLLFLLRQAQEPRHAKLMPLVRLTLDKMATGGIRDQFAGGFHRYSTERTWAVPHFEKMLYDQGQLLELYAESARLTGSATDLLVARSTLEFCRRELRLPSGFYAASIDADSAPPGSPGAHAEEGAFYAWTSRELDAVVGSDAASQALRARVGLGGAPNLDGRAYTVRLTSATDLAAPDLAPVRAKLLAARDARPRPRRDDKIVVAWNGLMLGGLASAARISGDPADLDAARELAAKLVALGDSLGRTVDARDAAPVPRGPAFLDDFAGVAHGLLNLADALPEAGRGPWLEAARKLCDRAIADYFDSELGEFTLQPVRGERLFARGADPIDGVLPSPSNLTLLNLTRLRKLRPGPRDAAILTNCLGRRARLAADSPTACPVAVTAIEYLLSDGGP